MLDLKQITTVKTTLTEREELLIKPDIGVLIFNNLSQISEDNKRLLTRVVITLNKDYVK